MKLILSTVLLVFSLHAQAQTYSCFRETDLSFQLTETSDQMAMTRNGVTEVMTNTKSNLITQAKDPIVFAEILVDVASNHPDISHDEFSRVSSIEWIEFTAPSKAKTILFNVFVGTEKVGVTLYLSDKRFVHCSPVSNLNN